MVNTNSLPRKTFASRSALSVLLGVVFLDNLGYAIVTPYLFFYVQSLGGSAFIYGALLASYSLMSFVFTPIVSQLSDRHGRRTVLLVALAVSSFSYAVFGLAQSIWLLFVSRMIAGTTGATVPVAQAYVADVTDEKNRLKYLGLLGAAAGIAFIVGPALGGTLSSWFGYGVPSFLASALAAVNLVSAYLRLREPAHEITNVKDSESMLESFKKMIAKERLALLLAVYFLVSLAFIFLPTVLPVWLSYNFGYGAFETGIMFFYVGAVTAFTQAIFLPIISKRTANERLLLYGVFLQAAGLIGLAAYANVFLLIVVGAIFSLGFGIFNAAVTTLISVNAPAKIRGGSLGVAWALSAVAQTIAPAFAAYAFSYGSSVGFIGLPFAVSGVIGLTAFPLVWLFIKKGTAASSQGRVSF